MQNIVEKEWIERLKENDERAFNDIYIKYWKQLYSIAFNRLKNKEVSEGLIHNVFADLWTRRTTIKIHTSLSSYLFKAMKFAVYNYIRNNINKEKIIAEMAFTIENNCNSTNNHILFNDLQSIVSKTVEALPERCREVYELSRGEQLSYSEIALRLSISPKTVENQINKALKSLRVALKDFISLLILLYHIL